MSKQLGFEFGDGYSDIAPEVRELKIKKTISKDKNLSAQQRAFNRNTKKVDSMTQQLTETQHKLDKLLEKYMGKIPVLEEAVAKKNIEMAMKIDEFYDKFKYTKREKENISEFISEKLSDSFASLEPNDEEKALFDKHSDSSYSEDLDLESEMMKSFFADLLRSETGVDISPDDIPNPDTATPEEMASFQAKIEQQFLEQEEEGSQKKTNQKKKTKRQLEKEQKQVALELEKQRSVRSIYLSLAKVLHPDVVNEGDNQAEREELMKKVTVAYKEKDLVTLLKLELEWIHNASDHLEELTQDKLKLYNDVLKEQIDELQSEIQNMYMNPRFQILGDIGYGNLKRGEREIENKNRELKSEFESISNAINGFKTKKMVLQYIEENLYVEDDFFNNFWGDDDYR